MIKWFVFLTILIVVIIIQGVYFIGKIKIKRWIVMNEHLRCDFYQTASPPKSPQCIMYKVSAREQFEENDYFCPANCKMKQNKDTFNKNHDWYVNRSFILVKEILGFIITSISAVYSAYMIIKG